MFFKKKEKKSEESTSHIDSIQKIAWRLVRSAENRFPEWTGDARLKWCVERLQVTFASERPDHLEDAIRAAYVNFRIETGDYQRPIPRL